MSIEPINISGPWDFEKYPIFPFYISDIRVSQTWRNELYESLGLLDVYRSQGAAIQIMTASSIIVIGEKSEPRMVDPALLYRFVKSRVLEVSKVRLADLRKKHDEEIIKLLAQNCHAALRRVAPTIETVSDDDDGKWYAVIRLKPQVLGKGGVPNPVFHRLFAREKVFINRDGLVEADPETRRVL